MHMKSQGSHFLRNTEGKGVVGCLIFILLLGIALFMAVQLGPVYYANYAMESELKKEISQAGAHALSDEQIIRDIMNMAKRNEVPLRAEDIIIDRVAGQIVVAVTYVVPVDFMVLERDLNFHIRVTSFVGSI